MNKRIKLILINLIIFVSLCLMLEYIEFEKHYSIEKRYGWKIKKIDFFINNFVLPLKTFDSALKKAASHTPIGSRINFRGDIIDKANKKSPIILFGCSYTFGVGLADNETFAYKLGEYTKRNVYNRGLAGYGIQQMLYMLNDFNIPKNVHDFFPSPSNSPKCVIYTFISDHIFRLYKPNDYFDIYLMYYKYKDGKLVKYTEKDIIWWHSYILRNYVFKKINKMIINGFDEKNLYLLDHFLASNKKIKEMYPNTDFVIFVYDGDKQIKLIQKELEAVGIKVVYLSNLSDIDFSQAEYKLSDGMHPNAKAWELIVPMLAKKLNL